MTREVFKKSDKSNVLKIGLNFRLLRNRVGLIISIQIEKSGALYRALDSICLCMFIRMRAQLQEAS
jgi:hypothetical protein